MELVERLREDVMLLANTPMNISLEVWEPVSARFLEAADLLEEALKALGQIDGEAPADEPDERPTVGFDPPRDPDDYDGNDVVEEAFQEGVVRGLWLAANTARAILTKSQGEKIDG